MFLKNPTLVARTCHSRRGGASPFKKAKQERKREKSDPGRQQQQQQQQQQIIITLIGIKTVTRMK